MCFIEKVMIGSVLHECLSSSQVSADERNPLKTTGQSPSSARRLLLWFVVFDLIQSIDWYNQNTLIQSIDWYNQNTKHKWAKCTTQSCGVITLLSTIHFLIMKCMGYASMNFVQCLELCMYICVYIYSIVLAHDLKSMEFKCKESETRCK